MFVIIVSVKNLVQGIDIIQEKIAKRILTVVTLAPEFLTIGLRLGLGISVLAMMNS